MRLLTLTKEWGGHEAGKQLAVVGPGETAEGWVYVDHLRAAMLVEAGYGEIAEATGQFVLAGVREAIEGGDVAEAQRLILDDLAAKAAAAPEAPGAPISPEGGQEGAAGDNHAPEAPLVAGDGAPKPQGDPAVTAAPQARKGGR